MFASSWRAPTAAVCIAAPTLFLALLACGKERLASRLENKCFEFDSAAFTEVTLGARGEGLLHTAAVVRLGGKETDSENAGRVWETRYDLQAPGLPHESSGMRSGFTFWVPESSNQIRLEWRDGLHGPILRLRVHDHLLTGTLTQTSDVVPNPDSGKVWNVRAHEVLCPVDRP